MVLKRRDKNGLVLMYYHLYEILPSFGMAVGTCNGYFSINFMGYMYDHDTDVILVRSDKTSHKFRAF